MTLHLHHCFDPSPSSSSAASSSSSHPSSQTVSNDRKRYKCEENHIIRCNSILSPLSSSMHTMPQCALPLSPSSSPSPSSYPSHIQHPYHRHRSTQSFLIFSLTFLLFSLLLLLSPLSTHSACLPPLLPFGTSISCNPSGGSTAVQSLSTCKIQCSAASPYYVDRGDDLVCHGNQWSGNQVIFFILSLFSCCTMFSHVVLHIISIALLMLLFIFI